MTVDNKAFDLLQNAISNKKPCAPIRHIIGEENISGAYAIQEAINKVRLDKGAQAIGAKIGSTSKAVRERFGLDQPDYGVLFDDMKIDCGTSISCKNLIQPKVEAEVAFVLSKDLEGEKISRVKLIGSIEAAYISIEVVDSHFKDWDITITDSIADNASSGLFALGERATRLTEVDLQRARMELKKNGEVVSKGITSASLDSPINALLWLAQKMNELGNPLRAGSIVLSGALGPVVDVKAGDIIEAEIDGMGTCMLSFTK